MNDPAALPRRRVGYTDEQIAEAKWGTGYGRRRHLVNHDLIRQMDAGGVDVSLLPTALCSASLALDFIDSVLLSGEVISLAPCKKCLAKVGAVSC